MRPHHLGAILLSITVASASALAAPPRDAPATAGPTAIDQNSGSASPSGSAGPVDPAGLTTPSIDVASAPAECRSAGTLVGAPAKISLALCVAHAQLKPLELVDAEASIQDVDAATAASLAMLDEVAASATAPWQIVALHAEGDLLASMTQRMLSTVPPPGAGAPDSLVALHDSRMALLQPRIQPWLDRAQQAFAEVDRIAKAHPDLTSQRQVTAAITDSRQRMH